MTNFHILFENHFKVFLPEIYIIFMALFLMIDGVIITNLKSYNYPYYIKEMSFYSVLSLSFTLVLIINNPLNNVIIFNNIFFTMKIGIYFLFRNKIKILISSILYLTFLENYRKNLKIFLELINQFY